MSRMYGFYAVLLNLKIFEYFRGVNNNQKMSTFEQFRRSHLRQNKSNSKQSFRSFEQSIRHLGTITFSTNEIKFKIDQKQGVKVNKDLNITNQTGSKVYFKIKCSNSEYFDVRPAQDILENNWTTNIVINFHQERARNALKYKGISNITNVSTFLKNTFFQISWGQINEQNVKRNLIPQLKYKQNIHVLLQQMQQRVFSNILNTQKSQRSRNVEPLQFSNNKSDRKISNIEGSQFNISTQDNTQMQSLLTIPIIFGVSFLSFVLGYCSG